MNRDSLLRELDDDQSDWMAFFSELWLHQHEVRGRAPYLPSPAEIEWRCAELRWLESFGFCRAFIVNVMEHDNPCIERVKQMVARHGPFETYRRCLPFMVETEYELEAFIGENTHDWTRRLQTAQAQGRREESEGSEG